MILSDKTLKWLLTNKELIKDQNYNNDQIQPASIDLRISETITLSAHSTKLASTLEYIQIPNDCIGRVEGRSSYGRLFIMIHSCAGFIDPGFKGEITLELVNFQNTPFTFNKGDKVCQLVLEKLDQTCERPYGHKDLNSHYQGQTGVTESYLKKNMRLG